MSAADDLKVLVTSRNPIILIESREEQAVIDGFRKLVVQASRALFCWSITTGLKRIDMNLDVQKFNDDPLKVLEQIKATQNPGIYILHDFHPYLTDPKIVRLVKEIALQYDMNKHTIVMVSHQIKLPPEIEHFARHFPWEAPDRKEVLEIVNQIAVEWMKVNGRKVSTNQQLLDKLVNNIIGLTRLQVQKLAHGAIYNDGAIDESDLRPVMKAKFELLDLKSVLQFEYDTAGYADLGGQAKLKNWLELRKKIFLGEAEVPGLPPPKGIMLLGVQGCGKSLAAKAVAGIFAVPLLRLDFGALYDKYHGESEKNLRDALQTASLMEPCVLWMDEIEKGLSVSDADEGTSKRILGTLLTWMAERKQKVFLVATSNDIEALPPELVRKGRLDEIFFVDLPTPAIREDIFRIHLGKRKLPVAQFNLAVLAEACEGFSGAEIEQAIVSGIYAALGKGGQLDESTLLSEIKNTYPLSVTMGERLAYLRDWAKNRTVAVD
ncbi:MAG: AAA family ATPase [Pseudomonadota bacterium]